MRRLVAFLLLLAAAFGQDTRRAPPPSDFDSEDTLRLLAGSVMSTRIVTRVTEVCAFGARPPGSRAASGATAWMKDQLVGAGLADAVVAIGDPTPDGVRREWIAASLAKKDGNRKIVLSARVSNDSASPGAHETAAGACALLESARVLKASRSKDQIAELPFDVLIEIDRPAAPQGAQAPAAPIAEIRFGELGLGAKRDCLFAFASGSPENLAAMLPKVAAILARWKGEKGFWKEFDILVDQSPGRSDDAFRLTLACTAGPDSVRVGAGAESRPAGDSCPVAGTAGDTPARTVALEPHNAVNATRFALFLIATLAAEQRRK